MTLSPRDHLRAALVLVHLVLILLLALPAPAVRPKDLEDPKVQRWFEARAAQLQGWGVATDAPTLTGHAVAWGGAWLSARGQAMPMARTYASWSGTGQSWGMFGSVPTTSAVFFVEVHRDAGWSRIYESRAHDMAWNRRWFDHERVRTFENQFTRKRNRKAYDRLATWLGPRVLRDHADLQGARMGMERVHIPEARVLARTRVLPRAETFWVTDLAVSP